MNDNIVGILDAAYLILTYVRFFVKVGYNEKCLCSPNLAQSSEFGWTLDQINIDFA